MCWTIRSSRDLPWTRKKRWKRSRGFRNWSRPNRSLKTRRRCRNARIATTRNSSNWHMQARRTGWSRRIGHCLNWQGARRATSDSGSPSPRHLCRASKRTFRPMRKRTQSTFKIRHIPPAQPIETTMNASHDLPHSAAVPAITSRLPNVGTTIFTVMSALATQKGAVNLGQGFPDFACDPRIVDAVATAMRDGHNQYPPMAGAAPLRHAIAKKIDRLYGREYDADREITVTADATQAILTAILCCVHPGDEVIVIEPMYDCYVPAIELAGGKTGFVLLEGPHSAL